MIAKNVAYLYVIQLLRLLLPLSLLSILTKSLAADQYGVYVYTLAAAAWLSILVEYGFNVSATRRISISVEDKKTRLVVLETQAAKLILGGVSAIFLVWALFHSTVFAGFRFWALCAWLLGVMVGLTPTYYFQGKSDLRIVAVSETVAGLAIFVCAFLFIRRPSQFWLLGFILIVARFCVWQAMDRLMFSRLGLRRAETFSWHLGKSALRDGWRIFLVQAAASLYTSFNVILLGSVSSPYAVAVYGSAERLVRAGLSFVGQATAAVFPHLNSLKVEQPQKLQKARLLSLLVFFIGSSLCVPALYFLAPAISTYLFSGHFPEIVDVLRIMAFVIPAIGISNVLAIHFLVVDRRENVLNLIVLSAVPISLLAGYYASKSFGAIGMTASWVGIEWYVSSVLLLVLFLKFKRSK